MEAMPNVGLDTEKQEVVVGKDLDGDGVVEEHEKIRIPIKDKRIWIAIVIGAMLCAAYFGWSIAIG